MTTKVFRCHSFEPTFVVLTWVVAHQTTLAVQFAHKELNQESQQPQILSPFTAKDDCLESKMSRARS